MDEGQKDDYSYILAKSQTEMSQASFSVPTNIVFCQLGQSLNVPGQLTLYKDP